ncbi:ribonuclease T2 family protein [Legionella erythra]|uniref:Ribonuclease, T2 family n=1 Tax=Legionella erythra TaxID=448 RepID=A0A0W0TVV5_LEGER|nr:ribonuclease T [Legionella erythra]KTC99843.1 ribonuclease, T2 family [Legionella erythra]
MIRIIVSLLSIYAVLAQASVPVEGTFIAGKSCPAYLSKNKKTNPANVSVEAGRRYPLIEINKPYKPVWLRIAIADGRWVASECGEADYQAKPAQCDQSPGMADSYVLALSWQPAFCQTYGYEAGKPECMKLKPASYAASHLALHGMWPNQNQCGQNYGFCGVEPQANHCDYPIVNLSDDVADSLRVLMPSYAFGSCLERHEWYKHGSCQILSADAYFSLAMRLTREADRSPLGNYLHEHLGKTVTRNELEDQVRLAFGSEAAKKVYLGCKNGLLVDIYIQLPALIPYSESLKSLVQQAPELKRHSGCPASVGISDFTKDAWF